jgi:hypothetical protein
VTVGDRIMTYLSSAAIPREMVIVEIDLAVVVVTTPEWYEEAGHAKPDGGRCWTYDRATGMEIDDELHFGPKWGMTGSFMKPERTSGPH